MRRGSGGDHHIRGFDSLRRFQSIAAPLVLAAVLVLLGTLLWQTGGDLGPVVTEPSKLGWGKDFWLKAFPPSLMANIAFWSTLSLNMPDFTRFAENQRAQRRGQAFGLPITMLVVTAMAILTTSLAAEYYGVDPSVLWNPAQLVSKFGSPAAVAAGAFVIVVSSFAVNTAAELVSPALDFAQHGAATDHLPHRGSACGHHRHPVPPVATAGQPRRLHLCLARVLRRRPRHGRRHPRGGLLATAQDEP